MIIQISRAHFPVTVLGFGRRAGVWMQGCSVGCAGCIALDTWDGDPEADIDVGRIVDWVRGLPADSMDGVTISGGEPFDQPEALHELVTALRAWCDEGAPGTRDLLCYSGRSLARLRREHQPILDLIDAIIPGPYVESLAPGLIWRGSANQDLVPLTPFGHHRYDPFVSRPAGRARLQATVDGATVRYVGVPQPGDLEAIGTALARRGLGRESATWLS